MSFNIKKISENFITPKGVRILVIIGIAGIALIFLSQFISFGGTKTQTVAAASSGSSVQSYTQQLEAKLKKIIGNIDGVGSVEIMVTVDSGTQYVYEQTAKETHNDTNQTQGDGGTQTTQNTNEETTPAIISAESGGEQPLIRTELMPDIKGVVVVCEGGGSAFVKENVTNAVCVALNLTANRICVIKKSK